ncbi:phosphoribosyltransferase [bacterium]|nr:MAG: phosphoribosyltransferase [bacterium]
MKTPIQIFSNLLDTLKARGALYVCPKAIDGVRLGPLVAYAGTYDDGGTPKHFVGDVYYNFAKVEEYPEITDHFLSFLVPELSRCASDLNFDLKSIDVVLGAPMGGIILAADLARLLGCRRVFAEKKIVVAATQFSREEAELIIGRHDIEEGENVIIVEDLCNNFTTTEQLVGLVDKRKANVLLLSCAINRSSKQYLKLNESALRTVSGLPYFSKQDERILRVAAALDIPTAQFRQDEPYVADDVAANNVVWKAKPEWARLAAAMEAHKSVELRMPTNEPVDDGSIS